MTETNLTCLYREKNGCYTIDKTFSGMRLHKRLKTKNHEIAIKRYHEEVISFTANKKLTCLSDKWRKTVNEAMCDSQSWFYNFLSGRKRRGKKNGGCSIGKDELKAILLASNGRCQITGIEFSFDKPNASKYCPFKPSVDRIDPKEGYHIRNIRIVCFCINVAMNTWGEGDFPRLARYFVCCKSPSSIPMSCLSWPRESGMWKTESVLDAGPQGRNRRSCIAPYVGRSPSRSYNQPE